MAISFEQEFSPVHGDYLEKRPKEPASSSEELNSPAEERGSPDEE